MHIFSRRVFENHRFGSYHGTGKANLIADQTIAGVEFSYNCLYKFRDSEEDEFYPARWKHEGLSLDILMGVPGTENGTHTCELKIAQKDYAYQRVNGKVRTLSLQEYAALDMARAERNESLAPADTDPSHYPLNLLLLRPIDVDGAQSATCDLTTVVDPDLYVRSGSGVKAISQAEYHREYTTAPGPGEQ